MTLINRQQFMSELSKLLTFMFKEDRSEIIQQYNEMLDNAEDEQAMLESFGSPTRLAVAISRSYQRDERKLSVHADSKDGEDDEAVKVKPVIPTQGKKSSAPIIKPNEPEPDAYIDIIEEIRREKAAEEGIEYKPIFFKEEPEPESEPEAEVDPEAEVPDEEAAEDAAEAVDEAGEAPAEEAAAADEEKAEGESEAAQTEAKADDEAADADTTEAAESEAETAPQAEEADEAEEAKADDGEAEAEAPAEAKAEEADGEETAEPVDETAHVLAKVFNEKPEAEPEKVRKTNVFALILYIIVSIPVGLVLLLVMLGLELGVLGCGLLGLRVGFGLLGFTFSGMSVFADVLLCFGVNIAVLALGMFVTWLAVWLIIVSVPGLIRGIKNLGIKLCVKEVEIDG